MPTGGKLFLRIVINQAYYPSLHKADFYAAKAASGASIAASGLLPDILTDRKKCITYISKFWLFFF